MLGFALRTSLRRGRTDLSVKKVHTEPSWATPLFVNKRASSSTLRSFSQCQKTISPIAIRSHLRAPISQPGGSQRMASTPSTSAFQSTSEPLVVVAGTPKEWALGNLRGKVVLVTGANAGIGKHTAAELYNHGATVVMACRSAERGELAKEEIEALHPGKDHGGTLTVKSVDLTDLHSVKRFGESMTKEFPRIDILFNNAGVGQLGRVPRTQQKLDGVFAVNYLAHFYLTSLLMPSLQNSPAARIVNLSSVMHHAASSDIVKAFLAMLQGKRTELSYSDSKLSLLLFTLELRRRLQHSNVTCVAVNPGFVRSEIWRGLQGDAAADPPLAARVWNWYTRTFALSPEQGASVSLAGAAIPPADLTGPSPPVYLVPYLVPNLPGLRLLCESQGPYAGPRSIPPRVPPNEAEVSKALWQASERFCAEFGQQHAEQ